MKLNLLIVFLLGVSVSATGMRGFTPIKGDERRLSPKSSSSKSSSSESSAEETKTVARVIVSEGGGVVRCSGKKCKQFFDMCVNDDNHQNREFNPPDDDSSSGSKSKSKSSSSDERRVRRLKTKTSSSTSKSKSDDDDDDAESKFYVLKLTRTDINNQCKGPLNREALWDSPSTSKSSSSSNKSGDERRLSPKSSSSKSSSSKSSSRSSSDKTKTVSVLVTDDYEVVRCYGSQSRCDRFYDRCVNDDNHQNRAFNLLDDSSSSGDSRVRRLKATSSTSKSKSNSSNDVRMVIFTSADIEDYCDVALHSRVFDSSSSSSSSTSKKSKK